MFGTLVIQTWEEALESASASSTARHIAPALGAFAPLGAFEFSCIQHLCDLGWALSLLWADPRVFLILQDLAWKLFPPDLPLSFLPAPSSLPSWNLKRSGVHVIDKLLPKYGWVSTKKKKSPLREDFEGSSRFKRICQPSRYLTAYHYGQNSLITEIGHFCVWSSLFFSFLWNTSCFLPIFGLSFAYWLIGVFILNWNMLNCHYSTSLTIHGIQHKIF